MENLNISLTPIEGDRPNFEQSTKVGLGVLCLITLVFGLMLKSIVFWHFSQIKIWSKPINVLILTDEFIFVISGSYILIQMPVWLFTETNALSVLDTWFGIQVNNQWYCSFYLSIASFHYYYGSLGSFGISLHRYVLILKPHWVKEPKQEKVLLIFILSFCLLLNCGLVVLNSYGNATRRTAFNTCIGRSPIFQVLVGSRSI